MAKVSIILGLYNSAKRLPKLLKSLKQQEGILNAELLAIDTSSTDNTTEYLQKVKKTLPFSLRIFKVKKENFGHGKTRNRILKSARGKIVVFISDDIEIISDNWLSELITPLKKNKVGAVFGRQVSYEKSSCYDHFFYLNAYPPSDRLIAKYDLEKFSATTIFYSMANACAWTELLLRNPFREDRDASVDQWWAKKILENGYYIFYNSRAVVKHSHFYNLKGLIKRQFLSGQSLRGFFNSSPLMTLQMGLKYILEETVYVVKNCPAKMLIFLPIYEGIRIGSFFWGKSSKKIPDFVNKL